jgi:hypothetical protein
MRTAKVLLDRAPCGLPADQIRGRCYDFENIGKKIDDFDRNHAAIMRRKQFLTLFLKKTAIFVAENGSKPSKIAIITLCNPRSFPHSTQSN